jgi:signal transduction histidine kinase
VLSADAGDDRRFSSSQSVVMQGIRSAMCVPMLHGGQILGAIHLDSQMATKVFDDADLELFTNIAAQAAMTVRNGLLAHRVHDLEQKQADAERQRSEAIRELISGASHFINNPLSVISSNLFTLLEWTEQLGAYHRAVREQCPPGSALRNLDEQHGIEYMDGELAAMCRESRSAANRIATVLSAMHAFDARCEERTAVPLRPLLEAAVAQVQGRRSVPAPLRLSCDAALTVLGNRERLLRVFVDLLLNACQAIDAAVLAGRTEEHGIAIQGSAGLDQVQLWLDDSGCGLPRDNEAKIWAPFYTTREDGSLGLGLAVAAETLHQHGGDISAQRRAPHGTRFTLTLPLAR